MYFCAHTVCHNTYGNVQQETERWRQHCANTATQ